MVVYKYITDLSYADMNISFTWTHLGKIKLTSVYYIMHYNTPMRHFGPCVTFRPCQCQFLDLPMSIFSPEAVPCQWHPPPRIKKVYRIRLKIKRDNKNQFRFRALARYFTLASALILGPKHDTRFEWLVLILQVYPINCGEYSQYPIHYDSNVNMPKTAFTSPEALNLKITILAVSVAFIGFQDFSMTIITFQCTPYTVKSLI